MNFAQPMFALFKRFAHTRLLAFMILIALACASVFIIERVQAASSHVDPAGLCGGNAPCFTTIQAAINAAAPGDTINVGAGTYAEQPTINKALTLLGPNANINPNTGTRVAEAVIIPTTSDPLNPSFAGPIVVNFAVSGITFRGFTVDGDNPALTSGVIFNGADVDAEFGIYGTETANPDAVISNNIVKNVGEMGIWINSNSQGGAKNANSRITTNKVDNLLGAFGQGIRISDDAWLDVTDNVLTRVRSGIVIENYSGNTTTHPASVISGNNITSFRIGIRHNLHYVYTNPGFTISNNTVQAYAPAGLPPQVTLPTAYQGIRVESIQQTVAVTVTNNSVDGNRSALGTAGYTRIDGINVTNSSATSPNILFTLNYVTDSLRGVFHETPATPTFSCNNITGNTTGVVLDPAATGGLVANNNNIFGNGAGAQNNAPPNINMQSNWWGAANGPGPVGPGSGDTVSANINFSNWLTSESDCPPACAANVALSSYGATATASSEYNASYSVAGIINGEHNSNMWGSNGGWNDATFGAFPDTATVNLNIVQAVSEIDVYTLKDEPNNGSIVTDATTFSNYGNTSFDVQYWNGSAWVTVPGGNVTGNTRVKRRFIFNTPISTDMVRVVVNDSADDAYSRIIEVEVYSCAPVVVPSPSPSPSPSASPSPCLNNVALASVGATTTASSEYSPAYSSAGVIDGEKNGNMWGSNGGWNDASYSVFPDNITVNLNVAQTISEIDVYTLKDDPNSGSVVTDATTFTAYGITNFDVQYWNGSAWVTVPGGNVTGNNKVLRRIVFSPITTDQIRVVVNNSADAAFSRIIEIEALSCSPVVVPSPSPTPTPCLTNIASSTNGSTAVASSTVNASYPASGTIDGEHNGNNWGSGGGWNDATYGAFPDNLQVNFNTNQNINQIDVYTLKDDPNSGSVVTDTTTFNNYGITNFNVQYWTGAAWVDVPGGAVAGNNLVKRKFLFPNITTDRIRIVVNDSADDVYSRIIEVEAFSCTPVVVRCVNNGGTGGCFSTIQGAVNASAPGDQVNVQPGTYDEDVNVNKAGLRLIGAGAGVTNIRGPIGGPGTTVQISASDVTVAGFTITRLGNNTTDWNNPGLNSAAIAVQGLSISGMLVRDNIITGNRTGIDVNNSNGHTIRNNVIDFNRTGLIYRNQTDNQTVAENFITNNWTVGVLFLDASGGSNVPVQTALHSTFSNNNLSANWYAQIVDRQSGGSLPAPGTTNYKNFRGNWYGTTSPVITTANSAEPGYAAQIPVAYGGSATPPGGQPDIAGPASANFQITPFLQSGTDTNVETTPGRGTFGFQGVPNTVLVSPANQNGWVFADDLPGTGTGSGGFEAGPATPPLGAGSAFLTVDANGRHILATGGYGGTRMDDLPGLLYGSYQDNNANTVVAASLQFDIDYDLNDAATAFAGRLVFEPYLSPAQGAVQQNVWQTWDARAGNWYGTRTTVTVNNVAGVAQPCQPATPCTWQQVLTLFPNAGVRNTPTSALLFKVGGPWSPGFDGNVDALNIRHGGSLINYNFEHVP